MGTHCCCHPLHGKLSFGSWYVVPDQVCDFVYKLEYHWLRASCALSQRQFVTCEILQLSVPSQFTIILHMSILYSPPKGIRSCAEIVSASSSSTVERKWLNCFLFFFKKNYSRMSIKFKTPVSAVQKWENKWLKLRQLWCSGVNTVLAYWAKCRRSASEAGIAAEQTSPIDRLAITEITLRMTSENIQCKHATVVQNGFTLQLAPFFSQSYCTSIPFWLSQAASWLKFKPLVMNCFLPCVCATDSSYSEVLCDSAMWQIC